MTNKNEEVRKLTYPIEKLKLPNDELVEVHRSPLGHPILVHYDLSGNIKDVKIR